MNNHTPHPNPLDFIEQIVEAKTEQLTELAEIANIDLEEDLAGANLRGVNLKGVNLNHACLRGTNLQDADLSEANLTGADLSKADLRGADLSRADLSATQVKGARLGGNIGLLEKTKFYLKKRGAIIEDCLLPGDAVETRIYVKPSSYMSDTESYQELASIIEQVLNAPTDDFSELATKAELALVDDLVGANLREVDLSGVDLSKADLTGADLRGAILKQTNLKDAKVERALFGNNLGISEATKYELEKLGAIFEELPRNNFPWLTHLQKLLLPVSIPDQVLAQLLDYCQEAAQSSRLIGTKLVYAVEGLFPNQSDRLNQLAEKVLLGYPRSSQVSSPAEAQFPKNYNAATSDEKMVLSLSAAKQIIDALTVEISPQQSRVERQWLTTAGWLMLEIEYLANDKLPKLEICGKLPCRGSLQLQGGEESTVVQSSDMGSLSVELLNPYPNEKYTLAVYFCDMEQKPLVFSIRTNVNQFSPAISIG